MKCHECPDYQVSCFEPQDPEVCEEEAAEREQREQEQDQVELGTKAARYARDLVVDELKELLELHASYWYCVDRTDQPEYILEEYGIDLKDEEARDTLDETLKTITNDITELLEAYQKGRVDHAAV